MAVNETLLLRDEQLFLVNELLMTESSAATECCSCCQEDGTCAHLEPADCITAGGTIIGQCESTGACCLDTGCDDTLTSCECSALGGDMNPGSTCAEAYPTGACCVAGSCSSMDSCDCATAGGSFVEGVSCSEGFPTGACCDATAPWCDEDDKCACQHDGKTWKSGDCDPNPCCGAIGSCCLSDTTCLTDLCLGECIDLDGVWLGQGSLCDVYTCSKGRCCYGEDYCQCTYVTKSECDALEGIWTSAIEDCTSYPCCDCEDCFHPLIGGVIAWVSGLSGSCCVGTTQYMLNWNASIWRPLNLATCSIPTKPSVTIGWYRLCSGPGCTGCGAWAARDFLSGSSSPCGSASCVSSESSVTSSAYNPCTGAWQTYYYGCALID